MNIAEAIIIESALEHYMGLWEIVWGLRSLEIGVTEEEAVPLATEATLSLLERGLLTLSESTEYLDPIREVAADEWNSVLEEPDSWAPGNDGPWFVVAPTSRGEALLSEAEKTILRSRESGPEPEDR